MFLIKEMSTPRRSLRQTAPKLPSVGGNPLLGVEPFQGRTLLGVQPGRSDRLNQQLQEIKHLQQENEARINQLLVTVQERQASPMWWTDFWAGLGTLVLFTLIVGLAVILISVGVWLWFHYPLALIVIPAIPLITFFGHFARDLFWEDASHKH